MGEAGREADSSSSEFSIWEPNFIPELSYKTMRLTWSRPRQCRLNEGGRGQFLIHSRSFHNHLRLSKCTSPSTLEAAPSHTPRW